MFQFKRIISFLLLALCLQWIIPASLWHSICDHTDTVDHFNSDKVTISIHHEHCLVLELSLPPMNHQEENPEIKSVQFKLVPFSIIAHEISVAEPEFFEVRGPPQLS